MAIDRAALLKQLYYTERHIAAGAEAIEKQREFVASLEAKGETVILPPARALLATKEQAHRGHIADRERIKRLLAKAGEA